MRRTLLLAAATAALMAAPVQAQITDTDAGKSWGTPHRSTSSGLPSESPQVESLERNDARVYGGAMGSGSAVDSTSSVQGGRIVTQSGQPGDPSWARQNNPPAGSYGSTTQMDTYSSGSTGYTGNASGMGSGSMAGSADITARRGRGQNDLELTQTWLLNELSAQGYTAVRDFRKSGENYLANVQDPQGRWMTVELDPRTRSITPVR